VLVSFYATQTSAHIYASKRALVNTHGLHAKRVSTDKAVNIELQLPTSGATRTVHSLSYLHRNAAFNETDDNNVSCRCVNTYIRVVITSTKTPKTPISRP
jgi:hypothetical protein